MLTLPHTLMGTTDLSLSKCFSDRLELPDCHGAQVEGVTCLSW